MSSRSCVAMRVLAATVAVGLGTAAPATASEDPVLARFDRAVGDDIGLRCRVEQMVPRPRPTDEAGDFLSAARTCWRFES